MSERIEHRPHVGSSKATRYCRLVILTHVTASRRIDIHVNIPLLGDRILAWWRPRGWVRNWDVLRLALPVARSVNIFSSSSQLDIFDGIVLFGIGIINFFIGGDDLLSREIEAIVIPVNFVEGTVKGTIENRMLLGGHFGEIIDTVTFELKHQKATGANQVGIGYLDGIVGSGCGIGTKIRSHAKDRRTDESSDQQSGESEKRRQT